MGPKISSRAIVMSLWTSVKMVGSTDELRPNRGPAGRPAIGQGDASSLARSGAVREPVRDDRAEIRGRIQQVVSIPPPLSV
jgi:hypothetical protein